MVIDPGAAPRPPPCGEGSCVAAGRGICGRLNKPPPRRFAPSLPTRGRVRNQAKPVKDAVLKLGEDRCQARFISREYCIPVAVSAFMHHMPPG